LKLLPIKVTLLTFTATEGAAVRTLMGRPAFYPTAISSLKILNSGVVSHLDVGASGNVAAAAFAARHLQPGSFHYLVTYGCAGSTDASMVCICDRGIKDPACRNPFLVNFARYVEIGRVEGHADPSDPTAQTTSPTETVRVKTAAYREPRSRFRLTLSEDLAFELRKSVSAGFASEKVIHVAPGSYPSGTHSSYADALAEVAGGGSVLIDMETAGVASGAPAFDDLTGVVRIVTDHGIDKSRDASKSLQQQRLNAHVGDLFEILDFLTRLRNAPFYELLTWVILGAARHVTRLDSGLGRLSDAETVEVMVNFAISLMDVYRPISGGIGWSSGAALGTLADRLAGEGYPRSGYSSERTLSDWGELAFACDAGSAEGYGLAAPRDDQLDADWTLIRPAQEARAVQLATAFRARLLQRLRER